MGIPTPTWKEGKIYSNYLIKEYLNGIKMEKDIIRVTSREGDTNISVDKIHKMWD